MTKYEFKELQNEIQICKNYLKFNLSDVSRDLIKLEIVKKERIYDKEKNNGKKSTIKKALLLLILLTTSVFADNIDMNKIKQIESSGNPLAYNKTSKAVGLYQITPVCLKDYNNYHTKKYTTKDLYDPIINEKIASWYLTKRIPQMLRYYAKPVTTKNTLISFNAGINYVVKNLDLPTETKNYLKKYKGVK